MNLFQITRTGTRLVRSFARYVQYYFVIVLCISPGNLLAATHSFQGVKLDLPVGSSLTWLVRDGKVNGQNASVAMVDLNGMFEPALAKFERAFRENGRYRKTDGDDGVILYQRRDKWFVSLQLTKSGAGVRANIMITEYDSGKLDKSLNAFSVPTTFEVVQVNRDAVSENASLVSKRSVEVSSQQLHRALAASGWKKVSTKRLSDIYGAQLQYMKRKKTMEILIVSNAVGDYASAAYINIPQ